jgi:hypothetical protein
VADSDAGIDAIVTLIMAIRRVMVAQQLQPECSLHFG